MSRLIYDLRIVSADRPYEKGTILRQGDEVDVLLSSGDRVKSKIHRITRYSIELENSDTWKSMTLEPGTEFGIVTPSGVVPVSFMAEISMSNGSYLLFSPVSDQSVMLSRVSRYTPIMNEVDMMEDYTGEDDVSSNGYNKWWTKASFMSDLSRMRLDDTTSKMILEKVLKARSLLRNLRRDSNRLSTIDKKLLLLNVEKLSLSIDQ